MGGLYARGRGLSRKKCSLSGFSPPARLYIVSEGQAKVNPNRPHGTIEEKKQSMNAGSGPPRALGFVLCPLYLLLSHAAACAQEKAGRFEAFVQGGPSFFTGLTLPTGRVATQLAIPPPGTPVPFFSRDQSSFGKTGKIFTGVRYYFRAHEAFEASYSYSPNRLQNTLTFFTAPALLPPRTAFLSESMRVHSVAFNYVRYLRQAGRVQPFATGGVGFSVFHPRFSPAETEFTTNFGGGADIRLSQRIKLRLDLRDFISDRPSSALKGQTHNVVPSVGLAFKLW